ncbi:MAG TPA: plastocyanin, partial [Lactobacillus sp.]|nr:plastocyanin [Lactobacillus sp.]
SSVRRLTNVGDNVLVQAPVYNIFYNSILNNGRHVLSSDLVLDDQDTYHIDWEDLEAKMAEPLTTLMILCNPHNPVGMIWSADTLARIGELAAKHHVVVLSDEIHGDITAPDKGYTPFASVNKVNEQNCVIAVSPSKTFNVAALHAATVIVPNETLRAVVNRGLNTDELAEPNSFAIPATIAAYTKGHQWVHDLRAYIEDNKQTVAKFVAENVPSVKVVAGDATYLVWLDTSKAGMPSDKLEQFIRQETGLFLSDGTVYGGDGREFLRMNVACPKERLMDGLNRLKQGIAAVK